MICNIVKRLLFCQNEATCGAIFNLFMVNAIRGKYGSFGKRLS